MNKLLWLLLFSVTWIGNIFGQYYDGDLYLQSQADVDEVAAMGYNTIFGELIIGYEFTGEESDINDLSGLMSIKGVVGKLFIGYNPHLKSLHGLDSLNHIDHIIDISNNDSLVNLNGLNNIIIYQFEPQYSGKFISIDNNAQLSSLEGFPSGITELDILHIDYNNNLNDFSAISNLHKIERLSLSNNNQLNNIAGLFSNLDTLTVLEVIGNENLEYIDDFERLKSVTIRIEDNPRLSYISGFDSVEVLYPSGIRIKNNPQLTTISGFNAISNIETLEIVDNPLLSSLACFSPVDTFRRAYIINNDKLSTINDLFDNCTSVEFLNISDNDRIKSFGPFDHPFPEKVKKITIMSNDSLTTIEGLLGVKRVEYSYLNGVHINFNPQLTSLYGLDSLQFVHNYFGVSANAIENYFPLSNLDTVLMYDIGVARNNVTSFDGLENLKYVGGRFLFINDSLNNIDAIAQNLRSVGGPIGCNNCPSLDSLVGFNQLNAERRWSLVAHHWPNLKYIDGFNSIDSINHLEIYNNDHLESIRGFENLINIGWGQPYDAFYFYSNPALTDVSGLCHLFSDGSIDGDFDLFGNGSGFNSVDSIVQWCITPTEDIPSSAAVANINVYPNPVSGELHIEVPAALLQSDLELVLMDISGHTVITKRIQRAGSIISTVNLPSGLYFLGVMEDRRLVSVRKVVVSD